MAWTAAAGSTFCFQPSPEDKEHLCFVLNDPMDFEGFSPQSCLFVNASTPRRGHDPTCIVPANCHPFIDHDSFIYYRFARLERAKFLEEKVGPPPAPFYRQHDPAPIGLIKFILSNMLRSPRTARDLKACAAIAFDKLIGIRP